jgi:hypothetical protein
MVLIKRLLLLIPVLVAVMYEVSAQDRCGTVQYENLLQSLNPSRKTTDQFEEWMKTKVTQARLQQKLSGRTAAATYTIPVVVHVIHNGEAVGTGTNISDAQINSQIAVLNEDFQRLNADASNTLPQFLSVAGSMNIEFVLAKQNPYGIATTGILRVKGSKTSWTVADNYELKGLSYWPAEKYLNLWVVNLSGSLLGYAQFPPTDGLTLGGLEANTSDRLTDGVVIDYTSFGSIDKGAFPVLVSPYNKGRTATHEIGHFLGLRHIWGDDSNCSTTTDYVEDTPKQNSNTSSCPTTTQTACGVESMFQNYMDYTFDACMNIYSKKQIERMEIVLHDSPRRASLLTSPGATAPAAAPNDLGLVDVAAPKSNSCSGFVTPVITVTNYGNNTITTAQLQLKINGTVAETINVTLNLTTLQSVTVSFSGISLAQGTSTQLSFTILTTNNTTDGNTQNNTLSQVTTVPTTTDASLAEIFNTVPLNWTIQNPDGLKTWENITANNGAADNRAMYINLYNNALENDGTSDWLVTPVMDFSLVNSALLKFDRAFALYSSSSSDALKILVSTNCGADFSQAITIFNKSGSALATSNNTTGSFTPTTSAQWTSETISLQQFVGQANIQLAFVVTNGAGRGNNLYLDNVLLTTDAFTDIVLISASSLSPVICSNTPVPVIKIKNNGSSPITSFNLDQTINGTTTTQSFTNLFIQPSEEKEFTLGALSLSSTAVNTITFNAKDPNGITTDALPANNVKAFTTVVNTANDIIPLRQTFESAFTPAWTIISQGTQRKWETANTNKGVSLLYRAFTNTALGSEAWFVSPLLDFTKAQEASLFFDISYAKSTQGNDGFKIVASTDCGVTYPLVLYQRTGDQLSVVNYNFAWSPITASDWKHEYVELADLVGQANVRLAFIATNNRGNNLYLDNLEFFTDSNPTPPSITSAYSIYSTVSDPSIFKITFNLQNKELIHLQVYNMMGQVVVDNLLPETLNQTYTVDFREQSTGIYIVRLQVDNFVGTQKIFVGR